MNIDAGLLSVVLAAAVAGKTVAQDLMPEKMAKVIMILADATVPGMDAKIIKIKEVLNIKDGDGFVAEIMAAGEGVSEDDLVGVRAMLLNASQKVNFVWLVKKSMGGVFEAMRILRVRRLRLRSPGRKLMDWILKNGLILKWSRNRN